MGFKSVFSLRSQLKQDRDYLCKCVFNITGTEVDNFSVYGTYFMDYVKNYLNGKENKLDILISDFITIKGKEIDKGVALIEMLKEKRFKNYMQNVLMEEDGGNFFSETEQKRINEALNMKGEKKQQEQKKEKDPPKRKKKRNEYRQIFRLVRDIKEENKSLGDEKTKKGLIRLLQLYTKNLGLENPSYKDLVNLFMNSWDQKMVTKDSLLKGKRKMKVRKSKTTANKEIKAFFVEIFNKEYKAYKKSKAKKKAKKKETPLEKALRISKEEADKREKQEKWDLERAIKMSEEGIS